MATKNEQDFDRAFKEMMAAATKVVNERRAAGDAPSDENPYARYLLPGQVTAHQPAAPLFDEAAVSKAVDDGLKSLKGGGFGEFVERVLGVGIKLLTGGIV